MSLCVFLRANRCITIPGIRSIRSSYHTASLIRYSGGEEKKKEEIVPKKSEEVQKKEYYTSTDIIERFEEINKIRTGQHDHGDQRIERETREKMKRVPHFPGDFSTLEEKHILYGPRGTVDDPVIVESVYPTRIVGCNGSEETQLHEILWHIVKREKPCICLECGQVFKLVTPEGEHIYDRHEHH